MNEAHPSSDAARRRLGFMSLTETAALALRDLLLAA
jgi:hypothetical protein